MCKMVAPLESSSGHMETCGGDQRRTGAVRGPFWNLDSSPGRRATLALAGRSGRPRGRRVSDRD